MRFRQLYVLAIIACGLLAIVTVMASSAAADSTLRIMPLGDSITAGTTDPNWVYPFSFGYRGTLYDQLNSAGYDFQFVGESPEPFNGVPYGVPPVIVGTDLRTVGQNHHRGYGGSSITHILNGSNGDTFNPGVVAALDTDEPDLILLMIGINDLATAGVTAPIASSRLDTLTNTIFSTKPDVNVIVAQIHSYKDGSLKEATVAYNDYIRETLVPTYAAQGYNITTVDQYANFLNPDGVTFDQSLYSNIIHPNATGYQLVANTWFEGIEALDLVDPQVRPIATGTYIEGTAAPTLPVNNLILQGSDTLSGSYAGGGVSPTATWSATLPDSMNNGVMTDANVQPLLAWDGLTDNFSWAVYEFDTSDTTGSTAGYDVSEILSYAGWSGARVNQAVEIKYALAGEDIVEGEELAHTLGSFYYTPSDNSGTSIFHYSTMSIANNDDSTMLSGISAIEVKYIDNMFNGLNGHTGEPGNYTAYKQLAVIGTPTVADIPGDANRDGKVDGSDVTILAGNWQYGVTGTADASWAMGDFNGDGKVDGSDVTILAGNWQAGVNAAAASVPEPSTIVGLLMLCVTGFLMRRN